jgi:beta-lactamase regulating signal transducer with metallopeptidase domain
MTSLLVMSINPLLQSASAHAAGSFVSSFWQGAILTAAVALCLRFAPRTTAAVRFAVWSATFAVLACLPILPASVFSSVTGLFSNTHSASSQLAVSSSSAPLIQLDLRWAIAIATLWTAASLYRTVDLALHCLRLRRLWVAAVPINAATSLTLPRNTAICTTLALDRPSVIGFLAPRILIPAWLLEKLTPAELDQIILHEAEHLRRRDDWTNLLQKLLLVLFPLNPAMIWIERRLCREREMACDEGVIERTHAPRAYATCLARLAETGLEHNVGMNRNLDALSLGSWSRRSELVLRVQSILNRQRILGPLGAGGLLAGITACILFGSVELSRCGQLVAFVSTAPAVTSEAAVTLPTQPMHRGYPAQTFHAEPAIAHMPTRIPATIPATSFDDRPSRASRPAAPAHRPTPLPVNPSANSEIESTDAFSAQPVAAEDPNQQQSFVVFTSWTSETASAEAAPSLQPKSQPASPSVTSNSAQPRVTRLTRLIFTVASPNSPNAPVPAYAAVPTPDGWLVIRL